MKKNLFRIIILSSAIGLFWSCDKALDHVDPVYTPTGYTSFVKIVHASPSFRQVFNNADTFNIFLNGAKVNGSLLTYNAVFPTATNLYAAVPAGQQSIRISEIGKTQVDSTILTINKTLTAGAYYSFIITDSLLSSNQSKQMWLTDNFVLTDTNNFNIRFVHAVLNDVGAVDVYSYRKAANIFSNITPTTATQFVTLPYTLLSDTLYVRAAGTQTEITRLNILNGSTTALNRGRAYTLLYKGQNGTTGTKGKTLTLYAND